MRLRDPLDDSEQSQEIPQAPGKVSVHLPQMAIFLPTQVKKKKSLALTHIGKKVYTGHLLKISNQLLTCTENDKKMNQEGKSLY